MLQNILSNNEVESLIGKRLLFKVLASIAGAWVSIAKTQLRIVLRRRVESALLGQLDASASVTRRTLVNSKIAPAGIPRLNDVHQRPFTWNGAATITKVVVSKPRLTRRKRDLRFADRAPSVILENDVRNVVRTCLSKRLLIGGIRRFERRSGKLSETVEKLTIQILYEKSPGRNGFAGLWGEPMLVAKRIQL